MIKEALSLILLLWLTAPAVAKEIVVLNGVTWEGENTTWTCDSCNGMDVVAFQHYLWTREDLKEKLVECEKNIWPFSHLCKQRETQLFECTQALGRETGFNFTSESVDEEC